MGTFDYSEFGDLAKELLAEFGEASEFHQQTPGTDDDPDKPWVPGDNQVTVHKPINIAFLPDERDMREFRSRSRRSTVAKGNTEAYMGPVPFVPTISDTIYRPSEDRTFSIEAIIQVKPSEQAASLYIMRLK